MMDNLANLPATVQIVLAVLLAVWLALLLLVPFMIESIRNSSRKSRAQLELLNQKMDRLIEILERSEPATRVVGPRSKQRGARAQGTDDIGVSAPTGAAASRECARRRGGDAAWRTRARHAGSVRETP